MAVCLALFLVGGWGLARDIWLESSLVRSEARAAALAREAERAQLLALRSHLDPHFLFNTLNAIAEWCREDGEVAERAVLQLSAMLRSRAGGRARADLAAARGAGAGRHAVRAAPPARSRARAPRAARAGSAARRRRCPRWCCCRWPRTRSSTAWRAGHGGDVVLAVEAGARRRAMLVVRLDNAGAFTGRRAGGLGLQMVERRLALAYDGRATLRIAAAGARTVAEVAVPVEAAPREERA